MTCISLPEGSGFLVEHISKRCAMTADPLVFNKQATDVRWTTGVAEHRTLQK